MRASLWKIITDSEGESTVTFKVPSSDLAEAIKLNLVSQKEIALTWKVIKSFKRSLKNARGKKQAKTLR